MSGETSPGRLRKRSLIVAGHATSVSLEQAFWDCLKRIAQAEGVSLAALAARVDAERGAANLSSALRVHALRWALTRAGEAQAPETSYTRFDKGT